MGRSGEYGSRRNALCRTISQPLRRAGWRLAPECTASDRLGGEEEAQSNGYLSRTGHDVGRRDRGSLAQVHALRVVGPVGRRPDPGRARRGRLFLFARRHALPRLQLAADERQHRPRRPARDRCDQGPGREARLCQPVHGHRATRATGREAGRARARRHRRLLLHQRRRRGERERDQARPPGDRPAEDPGPLPLVPRRNRWRHRRDRRPASLGGGERRVGRRPRTRLPPLGASPSPSRSRSRSARSRK